ncbi:MAG: hypothetical protein ACFB50_17340 [Rubrobacteraceae bacterium]
MIGELWQFLAVGAVGLVAAALWLLLIYLPRRSWDGDGNEEDNESK